MRSSLKANFASSVIGSGAFALGQWLIVVLIARLGTPALLGEYVLAVAIVGPILMLSNLKLRSVLATDARGDVHLTDFVKLRLMSSLLALTCSVVLGLILSLSRGQMLVLGSVATMRALWAVSDILHGYLQLMERMELIATSQVLASAMQVVTFGLSMHLTRNLVVSLSVLALTVAVGVVLFDVPLVRFVQAQEERGGECGANDRKSQCDLLARRKKGSGLSTLVWVSLPLGLAVSLGSLTINIPRYAIEHYRGGSELGYFGAVSSLVIAGTFLIGALGQAAAPRLAKLFAQGQTRQFNRLVRKLMVFGLVAGLLGVAVFSAFGSVLLGIIFAPEYSAYSSLLILLMAGGTLRLVYVFFGTAIQAMRNFRVHLPIQVGSLIVVICASLILIPSQGIVGAAWALMLVSLYELCAYWLGFKIVAERGRRA